MKRNKKLAQKRKSVKVYLSVQRLDMLQELSNVTKTSKSHILDIALESFLMQLLEQTGE